MALRDWGWFVIIQKTRPLIGMPNPEEELRLLEEKANATYGVYKEKVDTKAKLLEENKLIEQESVVIKKDIADIEMVIQKLEQEKTNRDHTIKSLNDEIANQDEVINKLNKEKKHISENSAKSS